MSGDETTIQIDGPAPARRLAQYELLRPVGTGAMGVVHQARDVDLDRPVAIKLLHSASAEDPKLIERFLREARSAAQLIHPNVALIYQVGRQDTLTFIAMEWLDGGDLSQAVRQRGPLPWREATAAIRDAAAGLAAAHAVGLVHRDIKPSNLMRNQAGQVKLVDFGLARLHAMPSDLTLTGSILGTPAYLSPEQCRGDAATPLSDLYSLACSYFHLLAGRPPYAAQHMAAVLNGHLNEAMPDPRRFSPEVPESVVRIVQRAGAKRPADRYPGAAAMLAELQAAIDGRELVEPPSAAREDAAAPRVSDNLGNPGNLGLDTTSFIGRDFETAQLGELLQQSRLVTLTGPGGTGKTRLSLHVARRLVETFADGAWLVELAPLAAGPAVVGALAALFGVRDGPGKSTDERLVDHLQTRELLLVLDNCEHVVDDAAAIAQRIHMRCDRVRILATSRQPLGVPGELTLGVPPLATGDEDATPLELERVEAIRLFVERAAAARPGFRLDDDNAAAVAQICRRLDGIPLAIELAAARVKVLAPAQIAARLDDAFKLLGGGQRTLLPRQQTLRALIDWSWDLLDDDERRLLARISVFAGDFSLEAAEAVLPDDESDAVLVLDGLAGLVDKSLLVASERGGRMRYRTLQTIRQYAAEKLAAAGQTLALQRRHADFYMALFQDAMARLDGPQHADATLALELEHDNARAALDAVTLQRWFDIGLRLAKALAGYWYLHGALADGVARIERLMAQDPPACAELAILLQPAGTLAMYLGRQELARDWFERGLQMARDAGRGALEGGLLGGLGSLAVARGELQVARQCFERSLELASQLRDRTGEAYAHNNLGIVLASMGEVAPAREHLNAALAFHRTANSQRDVANGLMSLGELEQADGQPGPARALFESSLNIFSALGDDWSAAYARDGLGKCALDSGDLAGARRHFEQALDVLRRLQDKGAVADQLDYLAQVSMLEQKFDSAARLADESLALRLELNNPASLASSMETYAALHAAEQPERSARLLGAMAALQDNTQATLPASRQARQQALCQALRARLGPQAFEQLRAEGARQDPALLARAPR